MTDCTHCAELQGEVDALNAKLERLEPAMAKLDEYLGGSIYGNWGAINVPFHLLRRVFLPYRGERLT